MATRRTRTVFADERLSVIAVESVALQSDRTSLGRYLTASLAPIAVVVKEAGRTRAIGMDGRPVDIDRLNLSGEETAPE